MTEGGRRIRHPLILAAAAALATLVLAAAGCGGSSNGDAAAAADADEKALRWAECMRKNGADVPDPKVDENGRLTIDGATEQPQRSAGYAKAFDACQDLFEQIRPPRASDMSAEERERFLAGALRYARCMRKHGIAIPDPSLTRDSAGVSLPDNVDPSSPAFKKAEAACGRLSDATNS